MEFTTLISTKQVKQHNTPEDCWIVIDDQVWDVTKFAPEHPGGVSFILKYAGRDATQGYAEFHAPSLVKDSLSLDCFKGNLDRSTIDEEWAKGPVPSNVSQAANDDEKPPLHNIINSYDFEEMASKIASKKTFAFYSTAATDCWTRDMNQSMYKRIWFRPRVMKDVAVVDSSSSIMGVPVNLPLFICPTGLARMINPEGEKALARAAKSTGILEICSTSASHPLDQILNEAPGYPFLFQLYVNKDRKKSEEVIKRATDLGIKAIFITVDAAGRAKRESDERIKVDEVIISPITGVRAKTDKKGGGLTRLMGSYIDQGLTWKDLKWIRGLTNLPIVLKGIQNSEDARLAMEHGVDGILVGNHGGRNLDYSPPSLLTLLELHKRCPEIFDRMEVYVDGGIRRGGDIVKALCLGAKAVGMGRPFLYSLAYGTEGAEHLVEILKDEMESVMKLIGIKNLSEVHPGLVNTSDIDHLVPSTPDHPYAKWRPRPQGPRL